MLILYREILQVFFSIHDPTTLNRQGADAGMQYRSVIFYHDDSQKKIAEEVMKEIEKTKIWSKPVVTQLAPLEKFYKAGGIPPELFQEQSRSGLLPDGNRTQGRKIPKAVLRQTQEMISRSL